MQYKILIVDDEPMLTELLADYLGDMGYLPFMATDSVQAMEKLKESPDLILLDINMPGMDGLELCKTIRDEVTCPILFLTARDAEQDKINGLLILVNLSRRTVHFKGTEIEFSKREFDILELLLTHAGQVFDRERIYESVWGLDASGDSGVVKEHIRKIRQKLQSVAGEDYIETVWGVGYRWKQ